MKRIPYCIMFICLLAWPGEDAVAARLAYLGLDPSYHTTHPETVILVGNVARWAGSSANPRIAYVQGSSGLTSQLTAAGLTDITQVADSALAGFDLSGYDVLYIGFDTTVGSEAAANIQAFVDGGGNLVFEPNATADWIPFGDQVGYTWSPHTNVVSITNTDHPIMQGLTNGGLSGWSNSVHARFNTPEAAGFDVLADDGAGAPTLIVRADGPTLNIEPAIPAAVNAQIDIPIELTTHGSSLAGTAFSIDYDGACLEFDPVDIDADDIPDNITFHSPPSFDTTVFFDLGDTDGEIDISIADAFAPIPLGDGDIVTVTFTTTCIPLPGTTTIAPVGFSADPSASFSDTDAQSIIGTTSDGSAEIYPGTRGDCNDDGLIDVADLIACELEVTDGDGSFWLDVPGGSYAGIPVGCDANADTTVDVGDLTCKNRLIFGLDCASGFQPFGGSDGNPRLSLPRLLTVDEGTVVIQVDLDTRGSALSGTIFALDYDQTRLRFNDTDTNLDGIPDAIRFLGTTVSRQEARFDASNVDAELVFVLADLVQTPRLLTDGSLVELEFQVLDPVSLIDAAVSFAKAPGASFGDTLGRSIPGSAGFDSNARLFLDGFESGTTSTWSSTLP